MGVRALALLLATVALAAAGACGGDEGEPAAAVLGEAGFKGVVADAVLRETDLEAEPGFGLRVEVTEGQTPNRLTLELEDAYARYRQDPSRRDAIVRELVGVAAERMAAGIETASFSDVRRDLLPLLKPPFAVRGLPGEPARTEHPGDLLVIYAVDTGEQRTVVMRADVARWGRPLAEIDRIARRNLARETEPAPCEPRADEKLCGWASGDGYDATRMIVPELRRGIEREIGRAVYAVPREDVFVALPIKLAPEIESRVLEDFTTAPNPVSPRLFVERRGELVPLPS